MMRLAQPVGAMAICSIFPGNDTEHATDFRPIADEKAEIQRRLNDLDRRVRYLEERVSIVRREGDEQHGVET